MAWSHDQRLRRMVLEATSDGQYHTQPSQTCNSGSSHLYKRTLDRELIGLDVPAPPTPTQKPRSISALLSSASRPSPSDASTSRPRKRPCRAHRSLPSNLKATPQNPATGSSSLPAASAGTQESIKEAQDRLDALLGEAMAKFAIVPKMRSKTSTAANTTLPKPLPGKARIPPSHNKAVPKTRFPAPAHVHIPPKAEPLKANVGLGSASPNDSVLHASRSPLSPIKNGAPRVGIPQKCRSSASGPVNMSKQFKSPLITAALPTRSSPRRTPHLASLSTPARASPLRSSAHPFPSRTPTILVRETPARAAKTKFGLLHNANIDIGEDDPVGDRSFDSFDGIFQEGGADIEALFKTVDGSQ